MSISWFEKLLNEQITLQANKEDNITDRVHYHEMIDFGGSVFDKY